MNSQTSFIFKTHGGSRRGAGRPRLREKRLAHNARPTLDDKTPSHVTLKFKDDVPNLRCEAFLLEFTRAVQKARAKGLAVTQFAIESNHIHLLIEVDSNDSLKRGLLSLQGCITWGLRRVFRYFGEVFVDRYHLHVIRSPTEMLRALTYVMFNHAHHCRLPWFADVFSSAFAFAELGNFVEKRTHPARWQQEISKALSQPASWLQVVGWKRAHARLRAAN